MRLALPIGAACVLAVYSAVLFTHFGGAGNAVASLAGVGVIIKTAFAVA